MRVCGCMCVCVRAGIRNSAPALQQDVSMCISMCMYLDVCMDRYGLV